MQQNLPQLVQHKDLIILLSETQEDRSDLELKKCLSSHSSGKWQKLLIM